MELLLRCAGALACLASTVLITVMLFALIRRFFPGAKNEKQSGLELPLLLFVLFIAGCLLFLSSIRLSSETMWPLIESLGIVLSARLVMSSSPLLGNGRAAIILRCVNPFKSGVS